MGLTAAGFDVLGVELDADACATHRAHAGPCVQADLTAYHPEGTYDLVAGGVPCDTFSTAGDRARLADPRGRLYRDWVRVGVEARARALLLENVTGVRTRGVLDTIRRAAARAGFRHATDADLNAADHGVPQHRRRTFLVAFRSAADAAAFRWPVPTHRRGGDLFCRPWRTTREALGLDGGYAVGRLAPGRVFQGMRALDVDAPSPTVVGARNPEWLVPLDRPAPCVMNREHQSALNFGAGGGASKPRRCGNVLNRALGRRLTLAELAILQGLPPGFAFTGNKGSSHRQVGDVVPPPLAEAVGRSIYAALAASTVEKTG